MTKETVKSEPMIPPALLFGRGRVWMAIDAAEAADCMTDTVEKMGGKVIKHREQRMKEVKDTTRRRSENIKVIGDGRPSLIGHSMPRLDLGRCKSCHLGKQARA